MAEFMFQNVAYRATVFRTGKTPIALKLRVKASVQGTLTYLLFVYKTQHNQLYSLISKCSLALLASWHS